MRALRRNLCFWARWWRRVKNRYLELCGGHRWNGRKWHRQGRNRLRRGCRDGHGIQARGDFCNRPAPAGIAAKSMSGDVKKRLWNSVGNGGIGLASSRQYGYLPCKSFDKRHPKRPDVRSGGKRRRSRFGSVVCVKLAGNLSSLADGKESIGGELELIGGGENVRWLDARMNEAKAMEVNERVEHGFKQGGIDDLAPVLHIERYDGEVQLNSGFGKVGLVIRAIERDVA